MVKINKFEKRNRSSKSTLIAAALVVTAATSFGTYASTEPQDSKDKNRAPFIQNLTDEQKKGLEQARTLFKSGDEEGAKAVLDNLNLEDLEWRFHVGQRVKSEVKDFIKNLTEEQQEGLKEARVLFESGKAEEAKALLDKLGIDLPQKFEMKLNLTEAQKTALKKAKELKDAGDEEGAKAILKNAGINFPEKPFGFHPMMSEAAQAALESSDFEAWKKAVITERPDSKMLQEIDETKFQAMVKIHAAMEAQDFETAKKLAEDAGLKMPHEGHFEGQMMDLNDAQKARLKEAKELMKSGNEEGAKAIFDELGLEPPMKGFVLNKMANLTDEQKEGMKKAHDMRKAGDKEGAKALMNTLNIPKPKDRMMEWMGADKETLES